MKVHTRRQRSGFSLTEMLVVIGLIAILLAVAVPSILYYQRELKLTELDDNARSVFVAAQNHLTALRSASAGELEVSAAVGRAAKAVPSGATPAGTELKYVSTDVVGAEPGWLVLPGSIESDLAEGCYLVEFEPKSGSVYGVFFMERGSKVLDESAYEDIYQYASGGNTCRTRDGRKAFLSSGGGFYVGYYGSNGALDMDRPDAQTLPQPKLKLINAEELRVEIEAESWPTGIEADKVYTSVTVSGGGATKNLVTEGAIRSGVTNTVVLDTLKTSGYNTNATQPTAGWTVGAPFAKWVENGGSYVITPGSDITVTVSIFYKPGAGEGVVALPQTASVTANSLFAARSGETVNVRYGRHLQNLNKNTAHLDEAITAARQVRAIDFAQVGAAPYSWESTYGRETLPFVPIDNEKLESYDGGSLTIQNLYAVKAGADYENAGLFGAFQGSELKNVKLVDARVRGSQSGGTLAGALAGASSSKPVTVSGCQVYITDLREDPPKVWGGRYAGGLAGQAGNAVITDGSFAATTVYGSQTATTTTGGLVGYSNGNLTVQNSYAAGHMTGGTNVAGLVGGGTGITIQDSYAAGTILKATGRAGGLSTGSATVRRSYAAVEYVETPAAENVYGLVPSGSCQNAYYLVKLGVNDKVMVSGVTAVTSTGKMRKDQGLNLGAAFKEGGNASVMAVPYNLPNQTDGTREPTLSAPYPYPTLALDAGGSAKTDLTHYGDWLEGNALRGVVSYYEQYETPSGLQTDYFYYSLNGDGVLETKGALNATGSLYSDGYAFLSLNKLHEDDQTTVPMMVAIGAGAEMAEYSTLYLGTCTDGLITYYAYGLPNSVLDGAVAAADYFLQLRVAGLDSSSELSSLWLNPHFGKTAYNGYGDTNPSKASGASKVPIPDGTGDVIPIRSVRQFNNMRKYPSDIKSWTQELDIDAAVYRGHQVVDSEGYLTLGGLRVTAQQADGTWAPVKETTLPAAYRLAMPPISMNYNTDTFGGAYDGGGKLIRNLSIGSYAVGSDRYGGLFYKLSGSAALKNICLADSDVTGVSGTSKDYTGALVAYTEGAVTDCAVENVSVSAPQAGSGTGGFAGGLVGYVRKGTVDGCQAVNCAVDGGAASYVGGFVGGFSEGSIQSSGVRVEGADPDALYKAKTVIGTGRVGGFAGIVGDGNRSGNIQYCYAAVQVTGKTAGGFVGELKNGKISDCYAGGHTKNGEYLPSAPNVTGTDSVGGFAGTWSGGSLDGLCYTTCSVSGDKNVDVFANGTKTAPEGCYAGGNVYVNGAKVGAGDHNSAKVTTGTLPAEAEATRAAAHPYDSTLPTVYPFKPVTDAAGGAMSHYGDWPKSSSSGANREWVQQITESTPKEYDNFDMSASWEGDTLNLTFDVKAVAGEQNVGNTGPNKNGVYAITTDLGYKMIFRIVYNGDGTYTINGADGSTWTSLATAPMGDPDRHVIFNFTIPTELIPPYVDSISIGAMEDEHILSNVTNKDPNYKGVEHLGLDKTITIDGDFSDWLGYEHQVMEGIPGGEQTPLNGHWTGSVLGYENKIYIHMVNEDKTDMPTYQTTLSGIGIFKMNFASDDVDLKFNDWSWVLGGKSYPSTVPATEEYVAGPVLSWYPREELGIVHAVLVVTEDRQEYELEIDLDTWAKHLGYENGDVINDFKVTLGDSQRVLEAKRDPKAG